MGLIDQVGLGLQKIGRDRESVAQLPQNVSAVASVGLFTSVVAMREWYRSIREIRVWLVPQKFWAATKEMSAAETVPSDPSRDSLASLLDLNRTLMRPESESDAALSF
jgi:hypothetical protein